MKIVKYIKLIAPFVILFTLLSMLTRELYSANHNMMTPDMTGQHVPAFSLPFISNPDKRMTPLTMRGKVSIINIWASWCSACKYEHPLLMRIKRDYGIPIYGILYKDDASNAIKYLSRRGNPYTSIGNDEDGDIGIDFGVYGTPETFVVSPKGEILYRQIGAMDQATWEKVIYPIIQQYEKK